MSDDWHTLRVPPEAYERAKAQKEADGRTWGDQIVRPDEDTEDSDDLDADELAEQITADLLAQLPPAIAEELH